MLESKRRLYVAETWLREGWEDIVAEANDAALVLAQSHALAVIKPDGLVAGVLEPTLEQLRASGFVPVAARAVQYNRHLMRMLWLYKLNTASIERVRIHDAILLSGPSVMLVLHDRQWQDTASVPASVRLTAVKGPSRPDRREPSHLRSRLGVQNRVLNFFHTTDEPADVVRELAMLFPSDECRTLLREAHAGDDRTGDALDIGAAVTPRAAVHDLDLGASLKRVATATRRRSSETHDDGERSRCARVLLLCDAGHRGTWRELDELISSTAVDPDPWDMITIAAHLAEHDEPHAGGQTLGNAPPDAWAS